MKLPTYIQLRQIKKLYLEQTNRSIKMPSDKDPSSTPSTASTASNKLSDAASQVKAKATELGQAAADKIEGGRGAAASGLASAATTLHNRAGDLPGGARVAGLAHSAAEKLTSTADYIRDHDMNAVVKDVQTLLKNNPGAALLGMGVIGFLLGRAFSSRD